MRYASMLADKIDEHKSSAWLLNTGWTGAGAATGGKRCPLRFTRAILDAIHSGELAKVEYETYPIFNLQVPKTCPGVPDEILNPKTAWHASTDFTTEVEKLAGLFTSNFDKYADRSSPEVIAAGPQVPSKDSVVTPTPDQAKAEAPTPAPVSEAPTNGVHLNGTTNGTHAPVQVPAQVQAPVPQALKAEPIPITTEPTKVPATTAAPITEAT